MGQAKKRGTFEQRRTESLLREVEKQERTRAALAERRERQRQYELENPAPVVISGRRNGRRSTLMAAATVATSVGMSAAYRKGGLK